MSKTTVVNLFGAPGSGKSTAAAGLFYFLKLKHYNCEIVREYVKSWSWENRKPGEYDQLYLLGKQAKYESLLYGKVDYIITDSPILLSGFYESLSGSNMCLIAAQHFLRKAEDNGVIYKNFFLHPHNNYDDRGRYQNEEEAAELSIKMRAWLEVNNVEFEDVHADDRVDPILYRLTER